MEQGNTPSPTPNPNPTNPPMSQQQQQQQQQQQLFQRQLFLLHQFQQQQQKQQQLLPPQNQPQQQNNNSSNAMSLQQQQQAMSRFPSNIDAHLRAPGLRSLHLQQQQQQQQQQNISAGNSAAPSSSPALAAAHQQQQQQAKAQMQQQQLQLQGNPVEVEMAQQDLMKICNPDVKRPFVSLEDAVLRLLPYHVVADFEAEEDDRMLDSDTTGQMPSRLQQWDHNILAKIAEFTTSFEKQVLAFNIMSRKRALGEFRSEERLMLEQALLIEEKQNILEIKHEMESRERATREAAEAKVRMAMAQAEQARTEAQAHAEMMARAPMRASAIGSHGDEGSGGRDMGPEHGGNIEGMIHGWGHNNNNNSQRDEEEPSEDFLNDDNEPENGEEAEMQEEWREAGELDLNTR